MNPPYSTTSSPSTTAAQASAHGPWVTYAVAAKLLGASRGTIRNYVARGYMRAFDSRPKYVATEDLLYVLERRRAKRTPLHLGARGVAPQDTFLPLALDGFAIYNQAITEHNRDLLLPAPDGYDHKDVAPPGLVLEQLQAEVEGLKSYVLDMSARFQKPPSLSPITDEEIYDTLASAIDDVNRPYSVPLCKKWVDLLPTFDHAWLRRLHEWANDHPDAAQELCGEEVVLYAPFLRIADRVRRYMEYASDGTPELVTLHRQAVNVWNHTSTLVHAAMVMEQMFHTEGVRMAPPGTSPTDQYILRRLRAEESKRR